MAMAAEKNSARRSGDEESIDESDADVLTLHRLDTDPRSREDRRRNSERMYADDEDEDVGGVDEDERAFLRDADLEAVASARAASRAAQAQSMDKTGRPEWLRDGIHAARTSRRVRIALGLGVVLLLFTIFSFAFDHSSEKVSNVYKWAGDIWHANPSAHPDLVEEGQPYAFPTDVGYPGFVQEGEFPSLEDEDRYVAEPTRGSSPIEVNVPELAKFDLFKHMGNLSPYYSSPGFGISNKDYRALPSACQVDRVHILHRHGSRYPTPSSPANLVRDFVRRARSIATKFSGPLSFLKYYDPDRLGLELLVPLGRQQLFESGVLHEMQYGHLIEADLKEFGKLFVRAGSQQRIVDSAIAFLQGIFANNWHEKTNLEVQIEAPGFNTTLAPNFACPRAGRPETEPGAEWGKNWTTTYLRHTVQRLSKYALGAPVDAALLNGMQQLCSYDTIAFGRSDFCALFTEQEWLDYEYYWDLVFFGSYGDGSPVGKAQGVGWLNEFMARFNESKWDASTQTSENSTFNLNPTTFPVRNKFYADFTHDSTIAGVLAALNLTEFNAPLPLNGSVDPNRRYRASTIVPFAARMVFEEISCSMTDAKTSLFSSNLMFTRSRQETSDEEDLPTSPPKQQFVRMLMNEAIVDLGQYPACTRRPDGMCEREQFIEALAKRNEWAQWDECFDVPVDPDIPSVEKGP